MGLVDIARRLGVALNTPRQWLKRGEMPEPRWSVSGRHAWDWPTIEAWARETKGLEAPGRLSA